MILYNVISIIDHTNDMYHRIHVSHVKMVSNGMMVNAINDFLCNNKYIISYLIKAYSITLFLINFCGVNETKLYIFYFINFNEN